jgi:hypothetical protein
MSMHLAALRLNLNWARRIHLLALLKWPVLVLPPLLVALVSGMRPSLVWVAGLSALAFVALRAWEVSRRRQFIREARFPPFLVAKLRSQ